MFTPIVHAHEPITLLGGGDANESGLLRALAFAPKVVAADGGARLAVAHRLVPEAVIGDFDSLDNATRAALDPEIFYHIAEQDSTDFDKALRSIQAPLVVGVGFSGARLDHQLAVFNTLVAHPRQRCMVLGPQDFAFLAPPKIQLGLAAGTVVSLFPMGPVTGRSTGLEWPIEGLTFAPDGRVGTSNRALGPVSLQFDAAKMLVILPISEFERAAQALLEEPAHW